MQIQIKIVNLTIRKKTTCIDENNCAVTLPVACAYKIAINFTWQDNFCCGKWPSKSWAPLLWGNEVFVLVTHDNEEDQGCQNPGLQGCNPPGFSDVTAGFLALEAWVFDGPDLNEALRAAYLTMKSEWASCMMSFSERMCSCCLVSTMCRFFRIFMAKVLFSSLLSWTCTPGITKGNSRLYMLGFYFRLNQLMSRHIAAPLTSSTRPKPPTPRVSMMLKSARLRLKKNAFSASYLPCQEKRKNVGTGLKMTWWIIEEIIHFQHPET